MWSRSAQRGPCGGDGANFLLMMERRLLKCRWRWPLLAGCSVVELKPATSEVSFYFFYFFSREQRTKPCFGERARDAPLCSLSLVLGVLGFFAVVVGGPRGTMLTKQLYFHAVEIILVSFGIHAAINGFYFCVTPNSHLLWWETVPKETVCSPNSKHTVVVFSHFFPPIIQ